MEEYRYFITDDSCVGALLKHNRINGKTMLLLMGYILQKQSVMSVQKSVDILISEYSFEIIQNNIDKVTLNTSDDTPYTYYDLIDENGYCEADGYMYTDIDRIAEHFSADKSKAMVKSINAFLPRPFSLSISSLYGLF